jgi:hypothetical protein
MLVVFENVKSSFPKCLSNNVLAFILGLVVPDILCVGDAVLWDDHGILAKADVVSLEPCDACISFSGSFRFISALSIDLYLETKANDGEHDT